MTSAQLDSYRLMVVDNGSAFKFHFGRSHSLVTHNALWRARGTTIVQFMSPDVQLMSPDVQLMSPDVRRRDTHVFKSRMLHTNTHVRCSLNDLRVRRGISGGWPKDIAIVPARVGGLDLQHSVHPRGSLLAWPSKCLVRRESVRHSNAYGVYGLVGEQ
jgi:hypothetical protein